MAHWQDPAQVTSPSPLPLPGTNSSSDSPASLQSNQQPANEPPLPVNNGARKFLTEFLNGKPVALEKSRTHTDSGATKGPKRFDLHMHPMLQLKEVKVLPEMPQRLARFCDMYLAKDNASYLTFSDTDTMTKKGSLRATKGQAFNKDVGSQEDSTIHYEESVVQAVGTATGIPCAIVSSTLLFDLPAWKSVLWWSQRPNSVSNRNFAHADAFVYPDQKLTKQLLSTSDKENFDLVHKFGLQNFLLWEFKNLKAGDRNLMLKILDIAKQPSFEWLTCKTGRIAAKNGTGMHDTLECKHTEHSVNGLRAVTGRDMGPDAADPTLMLHCPSNAPQAALLVLDAQLDSGLPGAYRGNDNLADDFEMHNLETIYEDDDAILTPATTVSSFASNSILGGTSDAQSPSKKLKKDVRSKLKPRNTKSSTKLGKKKATPARGRAKTLVDNATKARYIIQQAWAEMVNNDATYLIISSGNFEIIAMRHRASQTMYLSPLIEPPMDTAIPHAKLMTSLYIAAYKDAVDRAVQMNALMAVPRNRWSPAMQLLFDKNGNSILQDAKTSTEQIAAIKEELATDLKNASHIMCNLPNSLSGLPRARHNFCRPSGSTAFDNIAPHSEAGQSLCLSVKEASKITGTRIVQYTLSRDDSEDQTQVNLCYPGDLVMKFAETPHERRDLQREYQIYELLIRKGVKSLPRMFGLFTFDANKNLLGLLMEHRGSTLAYWREQNPTIQQKIIVKNKDQILDTLKALHKAGYVHGRIKADHILISNHGTPSLISLLQCAPYSIDSLPTSSLRPDKSTEEQSVESPREELSRLEALLIPCDPEDSGEGDDDGAGSMLEEEIGIGLMGEQGYGTDT